MFIMVKAKLEGQKERTITMVSDHIPQEVIRILIMKGF